MKNLRNEKLFRDLPSVETKAGERPRTLIVRISTPEVDRSKDIVEPMGMQATNFLKNPVVLFAHKYDEMPIAKCVDLRATDAGILATVEFLEEGVYNKSDIVYRMYKEGFLNAWSIGFSANDYDENEFGGYTFKKWELFEFSSVPVPDNPGALTVMRSKGIDVDALKEKGKPATTEKKEAPKEEKTEEKPEDKQEQPKEEVKETDKPKASEPAPVQKDVGEVVQLAYVLDTLSWFIYLFEENGVSKASIDKLNQALGLVLQVVQEQADLGKKSFDLADFPNTKEGVKILAKAGRTISAKNEGQLKEALELLKTATDKVQTVVDTVAEQEEEAEPDKSAQESLYKRLASQVDGTKKQLKKADKEVGLTLKLLNAIKSEKGGEN